MSLDLLDPPMAKPKAKAETVKLDMDVIESARVVAAIRNCRMSDMLSEILRPIIQDMEREALQQRMGTTTPKRRAKGGE